ncbi:MAG TPA: glycogen-binding domain-containing protein [Balneolaceae bacterium]
MRFILLAIILCVAATVGRSQQWQTVISLNTQVGYSTNSYLNPFLSEWNSGLESAYNFTSLLGQTYWYKNNHSVSVTGGFLYEPIFNSQTDPLKGGLGLINYNYRLTSSLSLGINTGASYLSSSYSRTLTWIQPKITWFISPFTLMRFKAGSSFRSYQDYADEQNGYSRFDLYGLEFEVWPSYRWQLTAGLYGSLNTLPSIQTGFNGQAGAGYHFRNGSAVTFTFGLQQYQYESTVTTGGGGPPAGFPPAGPGSSTSYTETNTNRILRFGINSSVPVNEQFTLFAEAEGLYFNSAASQPDVTDYQVSGGLRFSFEPEFRNDKKIISPEWNLNEDSQQVRIHYSGEGRLYVVGDFNNWNRAGIPLSEQSDNLYSTELMLSVGAYEYKILRVQGNTEEWLKFADDIYTVSDGFGSENAVLLVE